MGNGAAMSMAEVQIRAITFDVGGTLIEPWPSVGHIYAEVAAQFGLHGIEPEALNRGFVRTWRERRAFDYSRKAWRELVEKTFAGLVPEPPSAECFSAIYEHFAHAHAWRVFDDVADALTAVRRLGLKAGLISNWDERLRPLLDQLGLAGCFDAVTISCEAGHTKPSREIFRHCAAQLAQPEDCILHIGDSESEDVAGAKAAGMRALLLDRRSAPGKGRVASLTQAVESLGGNGYAEVSD